MSSEPIGRDLSVPLSSDIEFGRKLEKFISLYLEARKRLKAEGIRKPSIIQEDEKMDEILRERLIEDIKQPGIARKPECKVILHDENGSLTIEQKKDTE
jgi:hypothetical protein